jgi:hypothetical protein
MQKQQLMFVYDQGAREDITVHNNRFSSKSMKQKQKQYPHKLLMDIVWTWFLEVTTPRKPGLTGIWIIKCKHHCKSEDKSTLITESNIKNLKSWRQTYVQYSKTLAMYLGFRSMRSNHFSFPQAFFEDRTSLVQEPPLFSLVNGL